MEKSNLKNIVVLKNLPSNIVDEAIVILKPNKKIKKLEVVNKNSSTSNKKAHSEGYVLKEAEMLVSNYISKIEQKEKKTNSNNQLKQKYKRLKKYTFVSSLILIISIILNFI